MHSVVSCGPASERLWRYSAPELVLPLDPPPPTIASDCYALGCLLWEVLTCQQLWSGASEAQVRALMLRRLKPPVSEFFAPHVRALLQECWSEVPAERPMPAEILYRIAGGRNMAYMYLPKAAVHSSLRSSNTSQSQASDTQHAKKSKSVSWAPSPEQRYDSGAADTARDAVQQRLVFTSPSPREKQFDAVPLNVSHVSPQPALSTDREPHPSDSSHAPAQTREAARSQPPLHMHSGPRPSEVDSGNHAAYALPRDEKHGQPRVASSSQFSLHLSDPLLKASGDAAVTAQLQQYESDVKRAVAHMYTHSSRIQPGPVALPVQSALGASNAGAESPRLQTPTYAVAVSQQQQLALAEPASPTAPDSAPQAPPSHAMVEIHDCLPSSAAAHTTKPRLLDHALLGAQQSPSKPSAAHYNAASSLAAHVLAAKHLHSRDAAADPAKFHGCARVIAACDAVSNANVLQVCAGVEAGAGLAGADCASRSRWLCALAAAAAGVG
jgi:hypothetical protein